MVLWLLVLDGDAAGAGSTSCLLPLLALTVHAHDVVADVVLVLRAQLLI